MALPKGFNSVPVKKVHCCTSLVSLPFPSDLVILDDSQKSLSRVIWGFGVRSFLRKRIQSGPQERFLGEQGVKEHGGMGGLLKIIEVFASCL